MSRKYDLFCLFIAVITMFFAGCSNLVDSSKYAVHGDAVLRSYGGYLYVLERRGADNILKLDPSKIDAGRRELFVMQSDFQSGQVRSVSLEGDVSKVAIDKSVVYQRNLGINWNPQDVAIVNSTKGYISFNDEPKIAIVNPANGEVAGYIDIYDYTYLPSEINSSPNAGVMQLVGTDLYVMLQRRDGYNPGAPTLLLKIDTQTDEITDTIALEYKNGHSMAYYDGALYVTNPGDLFVQGDGAIERVDLATNEVTTVIDGEALGGDPNSIVHKEGSRFYITNYVGWLDVPVLEIDAATGEIIATLPNVIDAFGGIYYDTDEEVLYVGERDPEEMGIRIFIGNEQSGETVRSGSCLPPASMVVVE